MELKRKTYLCNLRHLLIVSAVSFLILKVHVLTAQEATTTVTQFADILLNKDVMQTVQIPDGNVNNEQNEQVTVTVDDSGVISLRLLDPALRVEDEGFDDDGILVGTSTTGNSGFLTGIAKPDNNDRLTYVIKGISQGTATVTSKVNGTSSIAPEALNMNVIGVEARFSISGQASGALPLSLTFSDASAGDNITSRKWDFGDGSSPVLDVTSTTHTFNTTGVHNVRLEITAQSNIGAVIDSTSTAICAFPQSGPIVPGFGSVHGVVWFEKTVAAGTFRVPLVGVDVTLVGKDTFTVKTGKDGIYDFDAVPSGNYAALACIFGICDKEDGDLVVTNNTDKNLEFVLTK